MNKKILIIGGTGLVGSRITDLLSDTYAFENLSRATHGDITDKQTILEKVMATDAEIVLHLAGKTNVDACEKDKALGREGDAWKMNVTGTENVVVACEEARKKLIFISTDFVFDGEQMPENGYSESDRQNPINWYGKTKYEAEMVIQKSKFSWLIVRIAYPYRAEFNPDSTGVEKKDFMRAILSRLQSGAEVQAITDHLFSPTFIDDIAFGLKTLIEQEQTGIMHLTGSGSLTPFDAAKILAKAFELDASLIKETTRLEYFKNGAPRPFQLGMNNAKIKKLGIQMSTFAEGIATVKKQRNNLKFEI